MNQLLRIFLFSFFVSLIISLILSIFSVSSFFFVFLFCFVVLILGFFLFELTNDSFNTQSSEQKIPLKKEKTITALMEDISHEMKTPVFSIQGYVETLLDGAMDDETVRKKYLQNLQNATNRLLVLISDLDTIHEFQKDEILLHYSSFDAVALVNEVFELLNEEAKRKNVILKTVSFPQKAMVSADRNKITQVFTNLISNAITYSDDASVVNISFEENGNDWKITVSDTGIGIPKDELKNIFTRFYRVEKSRDRKKGGSGLGLTIVKKILIAHNKDITVKSTLGEGTSFYFELGKA